MSTSALAFEKRVNDKGEVAVLYSPQYGAGWSSWSSENKAFMLFDSGLVDLALRSASVEEVEAFLKGKDFDPYCGGWRDIKVKWIAPGTSFKVTEYDGYESFEYRESDDWEVA